MNFMELYLLNRANKLGSTLNAGSGGDGFPTAMTGVKASNIPNTPHTVPALMTVNSRHGNFTISWSSGILQESNYHADLSSDASRNQCFWGAMGGGMQPNEGVLSAASGQGFVSEHPNQEPGGAEVHYATDDRIGKAHNWFGDGTSTNYTPVCMGVMFVKNPTNADVTRTVGLNYSDSVNVYITGAGIATITPNNVAKSATTGVTHANLLSVSTGSGGLSTSQTTSVTFAAGKTTALLFCSSGYFYTSSSLCMGAINCTLYGLDNLFDGTLEPDLDMHATALQTRNDSFQLSQPEELWQECGNVLGD
jgi:hypothetical protein